MWLLIEKLQFELRGFLYSSRVPGLQTLTVGAYRRYWRKECFIPSPEGLLLRSPKGLKVARLPRPPRF